MTDLSAYRHLFRRTGVEHTEYLWPRIFSDPVTKFWHIPEDAVTGISVGESLFLFDEKNKFIGHAEGEHCKSSRNKVKTFHRRLFVAENTKIEKK